MATCCSLLTCMLLLRFSGHPVPVRCCRHVSCRVRWWQPGWEAVRPGRRWRRAAEVGDLVVLGGEAGQRLGPGGHDALLVVAELAQDQVQVALLLVPVDPTSRPATSSAGPGRRPAP